MKLYFAPMEGITGYIFRNAYEQCFGGSIEKYFAPFITASDRKELSAKEIKDLLPKNNQTLTLVPQILGNDAKAFAHTAEQIVEMGYREINLNIGCPSKTVVTKKKGAGLLAYPSMLEEYLDGVFEYVVQKNLLLSVKTRIGMSEECEFERILKLYNTYPIMELILHPRTQEDYYQKPVRMNPYEYALKQTKAPLIYNGDLLDESALCRFMQRYPRQETFMLGRGLVMRPGFANEGKVDFLQQKKKIWQFHDAVYAGYVENLQGYQNILFKMKELFSYFQVGLLDDLEEEQKRDFEKLLKELRKAKDKCGYEAVIVKLKQI